MNMHVCWTTSRHRQTYTNSITSPLPHAYMHACMQMAAHPWSRSDLGQCSTRHKTYPANPSDSRLPIPGERRMYRPVLYYLCTFVDNTYKSISNIPYYSYNITLSFPLPSRYRAAVGRTKSCSWAYVRKSPLLPLPGDKPYCSHSLHQACCLSVLCREGS